MIRRKHRGWEGITVTPPRKHGKNGTISQESAYYPLDALLEIAPEREPMTEDEAVLSCQKGDKDAFRYLVELYKDVVFGTAYMMIGNRSLAEEQMQEAFLAAWLGIQGFEAGRPFKPWLVRILVNRILTLQRKHVIPTVPLDGLDPSNQSVDPAEEVEAMDRRVTVRKTLSGLNQEHRQVVILRYFAGLTVPELAHAIGKREGTVKSRIHRALGRLREQLSQVAAGEVDHSG